MGGGRAAVGKRRKKKEEEEKRWNAEIERVVTLEVSNISYRFVSL